MVGIRPAGSINSNRNGETWLIRKRKRKSTASRTRINPTMKRHINSDHWDTKLDQPDGKIKTQRLETIFVEGGQNKRITVSIQFVRSGLYLDSEWRELISNTSKRSSKGYER